MVWRAFPPHEHSVLWEEATSAAGEEKAEMVLEIGAKAPGFSLSGVDGKMYSLRDSLPF